MAHHPVMRMVRMLSTAHGTQVAMRTGQMSFGDVARKVVFSREHFPKFLAFTMATSGFAGFSYMESRQERRIQLAEELHMAVVEQNLTRSVNQEMVNSMIEDARSSTWKENLEKVSDAHDSFIFGSNSAPQRLIKRLTKRVTSQTEELMSWRSLEPQS